MEPAPPPLAPPRPPSAMPPMCTACGQMLQGMEAKCPSCGAPLRTTARPARRSSRLTIAAVLFLGLLLTTVFIAGFSLTRADSIATGSGSLGSFSYAVTGHVHYANGTAASGVNITVDGTGANTTTDAAGAYTVGSLPMGFHRIRYNATGHTMVEERVYLYQDVTVDPRLAPGVGTVVQDHETYRTLVRSVNVCGGILVLVALLLLVGAIACYRRRNYALALTAAWSSLATVVVFLPALLVSFILIVLIVRSKGEFA